jgi:hypothetical protein
MEFPSPAGGGAPTAIVNNNPNTMLFGGEAAEAENYSTLPHAGHENVGREKARCGFPPGHTTSISISRYMT